MLRRYGPQELLATAASVLWCAAALGLGDGGPQRALWLGPGAALVEYGMYYGIALWRQGGGTWRQGLGRLAREYGPAEAIDGLVRPCLMTLGASATAHPALGLVAGSLASDALFYAGLALRLRRVGGIERPT